MANFSLLQGALAILLTLPTAQAALETHPTTRSRDHGDFANPASRDRPRFRYWLPDASIDKEVLKQDIRDAGAIGAGGVEFVPFYNYGGGLGGPPPGVDWSEYGFGSPAFLEVLEAALEAHDEEQLAMDFGFGPSEGQGVPASPDDDRLQWELVPYQESVDRRGFYNQTIPGWGEGRLLVVVSAFAAASQNMTRQRDDLAGIGDPPSAHWERITLRNHTLKDMTDMVDSSNGHLSAQFPRPCGSGQFRVFAFYERQTKHQNLKHMLNSTGELWDQGAYTVDHFSGRGAEVTTQFWDKYILSHATILEKLKQVGNYGWEDSLELESTISWSPTLPGRFLKRFGYDIRRYLPLLAFGNNNVNIQYSEPGSFEAVLDTEDAGLGYLHDYRASLADGYIEYLGVLRTWLRKSLNLPLSVQPSYNMPMDMLSIIPHVDAPESESLQAENNIDAYRNFAGPANLAGGKNTIISNELGAIFFRGYSLPVQELLHIANRGFAGGLNQFVIHGQPYSGDYPGTTWPGHTPFSYHAADLYSPKRPDWNHGLGQALDYMGRIQHVQRQGVARTDVALYQKKSVTDPHFGTVYEGKDLIASGWSFNYLTSDNLDLKKAIVQDGHLAPDGPAYQAIVVPGEFNLTLSAAQHLHEYAAGGLPIIFSDFVSASYPSGAGADEAHIEKAIESLLEAENVHVVPAGQVSDLLYSLGLKPRVGTEFQGEGTWYTSWREDTDADIGYAYIYCDLRPASGHLTIQSTKKPWLLDPWKGTRSPVLHYRVEDDQTVIPLSLAGNQTHILAFTDEPLDASGSTQTASSDNWFEYLPESIFGVGVDEAGLFLDVPAIAAGQEATTSSGKKITLKSNASAAFEIDSWKLIVEHWEAPEDMMSASTIARRRNTTHEIEELVSWLDIPELSTVSGLGYYTTALSWTHGPDSPFGLYIRFPPALNTIILRVNGQATQPLDVTAPAIDLTPYLVKGDNEIVAVVPTTMWNYLSTIADELRTGGGVPIFKLLGLEYPLTDNGLVGRVDVIPFERIHID